MPNERWYRGKGRRRAELVLWSTNADIFNEFEKVSEGGLEHEGKDDLLRIREIIRPD
jgi:hypothetical protein